MTDEPLELITAYPIRQLVRQEIVVGDFHQQRFECLVPDPVFAAVLIVEQNLGLEEL